MEKMLVKAVSTSASESKYEGRAPELGQDFSGAGAADEVEKSRHSRKRQGKPGSRTRVLRTNKSSCCVTLPLGSVCNKKTVSWPFGPGEVQVTTLWAPWASGCGAAGARTD